VKAATETTLTAVQLPMAISLKGHPSEDHSGQAGLEIRARLGRSRSSETGHATKGHLSLSMRQMSLGQVTSELAGNSSIKPQSAPPGAAMVSSGQLFTLEGCAFFHSFLCRSMPRPRLSKRPTQMVHFLQDIGSRDVTVRQRRRPRLFCHRYFLQGDLHEL
jgi:hypothetical protein